MESTDGKLGEQFNSSLKVSDEVIARVVGLAAMEEPGVTALTNTLVEGITEHLARKTAYKGVRVFVEGGRADIELHVVVQYGHPIPDLAQRIQTRVKSQVERMIGLTVRAVHVHIQGILFDDAKAPD